MTTAWHLDSRELHCLWKRRLGRCACSLMLCPRPPSHCTWTSSSSSYTCSSFSEIGTIEHLAACPAYSLWHAALYFTPTTFVCPARAAPTNEQQCVFVYAGFKVIDPRRCGISLFAAAGGQMNTVRTKPTMSPAVLNLERIHEDLSHQGTKIQKNFCRLKLKIRQLKWSGLVLRGLINIMGEVFPELPTRQDAACTQKLQQPAERRLETLVCAETVVLAASRHTREPSEN